MILEQKLGTEHPNTVASLNNLATFYMDRDKYTEAEPLLKRALVISERQLEVERPVITNNPNNIAVLRKLNLLYQLGSLYENQRKYN